MGKYESKKIELPTNAREYMLKGVRRAEVEMKRKKIFRTIGIGSVAIFAVVVVGFANPTFAKDTPILKNIFEYFQGNDESVKENLSDNAEVIGIIKESNGVKFTVEEVVCDGNRVYLSYRIENKEAFPNNMVEREEVEEDEVGRNISSKLVKVPIDEMALVFKSNLDDVDNSQNKDKFMPLRSKIKMIDDNTVVGLLEFMVPTNEKGEALESFDLNLAINKFIVEPEKTENTLYIGTTDIEIPKDWYQVSGEWNFEIPVKVDKSMIKEYEVNEVKDGFKLEKIKVTPYHIEAKIVPIREENQNVIEHDTKGPQLQHGRLMGESGKEYGFGEGSEPREDADVKGTIYLESYWNLKGEEKYYKVIIEDENRPGAPCTKECENPEHHENSNHPTIIEFDTKIEL